jgi:hypothetical protein
MVSVVAKKSSGQVVIEFKSLKYHDETYNIGDIVMISEHNDDTSFGTLVRIWRKKDKADPMARIRWFYKPSDIFPEKFGFLSQYELFDSDHEQDISVMSLYGKATVLSFEEYHALDEVDDDVFFCRGKYFVNDKSVRPSFEEWQRVCVCNEILNPDLIFVECDKCRKLHHPQCVGVEGKEDEPWVCFKCVINS